MPVAVGKRLVAAGILILVVLSGGCGGEESASEGEGGNLSVATGGTALLYLELVTIAIGLAALGAAVAIHLVARRTRGEPALGARRGVRPSA